MARDRLGRARALVAAGRRCLTGTLGDLRVRVQAGHVPTTADRDPVPADGSLVASVPDHGAEEVRAVAGLRRNQPAWEALGPTGRGEWVGRLRDWLFDNDERIAELLQRETGKPWQEASLEVPLAGRGARAVGRRRGRGQAV